MPEELEPPPAWECFADRVTDYISTHPECDLDDAIEALIWGEGDDDDRQH